jgi:hypothetical protein
VFDAAGGKIYNCIIQAASQNMPFKKIDEAHSTTTGGICYNFVNFVEDPGVQTF